MWLRSVKFILTKFFIKASFLCSELADFFHSLPLVFLNPSDLVELNNRHYAKGYILRAWEQNVGNGLSPVEESFISKYGFAGANALVLGCGAGREALVLAERGFQVTGVDSSLGMIDAARKIAEGRQLKIDFALVSLYDIDTMGGLFDLVFLGINYGMIPSQGLRLRVLDKIRNVLNPAGMVFIAFMESQPSKYSNLQYAGYKLLAYLSFGNTGIEKGDRILGTGEFYHYFDSSDSMIQEIRSAGFSVEGWDKEENALFLKRTALDA